MQNDFGLSKMDRLKAESETLFWNAYSRGYPLGRIRDVIVNQFKKAGVLPPIDVLAYAVPGLSDRMVSDWESGLDTTESWFKSLERKN